MASSSFQPIDLSPEPDLHPLYPTPAYISVLLSSHSGLAPSQKAELVTHCINRACVFGDLQVIQYLLSDHQTHAYLDLGIRDEDGIGLVSLAIQGFGAESDRDVEREECVRLLIAQGADLSADNGAFRLAAFMTRTEKIYTSSWMDTTAPCGPSFSSDLDIASNDTRVFTVCGHSL